MMKKSYIAFILPFFFTVFPLKAGFNPYGATIEEIDAKIARLHHKISLLDTTDEKTRFIFSQQTRCLETPKSYLSLPQTTDDEKNKKQNLISLLLESYARIKEEKSTHTHKTKLSSALTNSSPFLDIIDIPSHITYPTLEQIEEVFPIKAKSFSKEAIRILQSEEKENTSTKEITRCKYLTAREARKLFEGNLDELLENESDKEKIKDKIFTLRFFGVERDEKRVISLWEACQKIFSSKGEVDFLGIKSVQNFIHFVLNTSTLDLFLGSTPEEIKKGQRLCLKSWVEDDSLSLKYFFKKSSDFLTCEQFYNLFGNISQFFKSEEELEHYWLANDYGFIARAEFKSLCQQLKESFI